MKRAVDTWSVEDMSARFAEIEFPEYQREPNIWDRDAKQKLIDSMMREFDIASLYFYQRDDDVLECIDGRQRLNAIMSFLGRNQHDREDNGFPYKVRNEVYLEEAGPSARLDGLSFAEILTICADPADERCGVAAEAAARIKNFPIVVVLLSDAGRPEEFNLQFLRLNLGVLVNAGEKLNAMVGNMRELVFGERGLGKHPLLQAVEIPTRRFAREIVAAQILCQVFSYAEDGSFTRARHFDLQSFFKKYASVDTEHTLITQVVQVLDWLGEALGNRPGLLRNRAMTVSVVLLVWRLGLYERPDEAERFVGFLEAFIARLHRQIENMKAFAVDDRYAYLVDFQRDITQAAVEKPAVQRRHDLLVAEWERWRQFGFIRGDQPAVL